MAISLQTIGNHYFEETHFGPQQHRLLSIQNQFNNGCDHIIRLLKATQTFLCYNFEMMCPDPVESELVRCKELSTAHVTCAHC